MSTQENRVEHRRQVLRALAGLGGAAGAAAVLPSRWTKPVIDGVALPAHAQASPPVFSVSCTATPVSGSNVTPGVGVSSTVTVTPNPGAGQPIQVEVFCAGVSLGDPVTAQTNPDGQYAFGVTDAAVLCASGELRIRMSYLGSSCDSYWQVLAP
jgi:hypothetical protein